MSQDLRDFEKNLPMALLRSREVIMSQFRPILRAHDVTEQQWRVIRSLYGEDGMEPTAISQKTLLLMPSLTRILKFLEEQNLIECFAVEGDNRRKLISLSAKGHDLHKKIAPLSEKEYMKIETRIGRKKLDELYSLLKLISD